MNNIIIRESASEMRAIARNALRGNWQKVFIGMLIYYLVTTTVPLLLNTAIPNPFPAYYNEALEESVRFSIGSLYKYVLEGAFSVGLCSFMLFFFRKKDIHPGYLFNGFEYFVKTFCLMFMISLFTFLWGLLFVIPGIIAALRYSQAFYILADHPEKGVMQCINESKMLMKGNKGRFFYTSLTFFGWSCLAAIPSALGLMTDGIFGVAVSLVCDIPLMFVLVYLHTTRTVFYDLASGNLIAQAEPEFVEEDYHF